MCTLINVKAEQAMVHAQGSIVWQPCFVCRALFNFKVVSLTHLAFISWAMNMALMLSAPGFAAAAHQQGGRLNACGPIAGRSCDYFQTAAHDRIVRRG